MTTENFIRHYGEVLTPDLCQTLIRYFEEMSAAGFGSLRKDSRVRKDDEAVHVARDELIKLSGSQTLSNALFEILPKVVKAYTEEFAILETVGDLNIFDFKIQKTKVGGGYHVWHFESDSRRQGGRVMVYTIYLNDVAEGGETEFLYYPMRIKPKQGSALIFPAGYTHTHRGNPPISNEKYIITGWIEF